MPVFSHGDGPPFSFSFVRSVFPPGKKKLFFSLEKGGPPWEAPFSSPGFVENSPPVKKEFAFRPP